MERLRIYDVVDKEFIESSESESGKSDFDDQYYHCKPPLSEDYLNKHIEIVMPNQFSADRKNVSIDNYGSKLLEDIFDPVDGLRYEFRPTKLVDGVRNDIWPLGLINFVESKAKLPVRKEEVHDSKTDNSPELFRATSRQEDAKKESNQQEVFEAKDQQRKPFFVGFTLLICVCILFVFILHNPSSWSWLHSKINLIKCGFLCELEES